MDAESSNRAALIQKLQQAELGVTVKGDQIILGPESASCCEIPGDPSCCAKTSPTPVQSVNGGFPPMGARDNAVPFMPEGGSIKTGPMPGVPFHSFGFGEDGGAFERSDGWGFTPGGRTSGVRGSRAGEIGWATKYCCQCWEKYEVLTTPTCGPWTQTEGPVIATPFGAAAKWLGGVRWVRTCTWTVKATKYAAFGTCNYWTWVFWGCDTYGPAMVWGTENKQVTREEERTTSRLGPFPSDSEPCGLSAPTGDPMIMGECFVPGY